MSSESAAADAAENPQPKRREFTPQEKELNELKGNILVRACADRSFFLFPCTPAVAPRISSRASHPGIHPWLALYYWEREQQA